MNRGKQLRMFFDTFDWNSDINLARGDGCIKGNIFMFTLGRLCVDFV